MPVELPLLIATDGWLLLAFSLVMFGLVILAEYAHRRGLCSPASHRNLVHLAAGSVAACCPMLFTFQAGPLLLTALFLLFNSLTFKKKLLAGIHTAPRPSYGSLFFPLAFFLVFLLFWQQPLVSILALLIMTWADPAAAYVGRSLKKPHTYQLWQEVKSLEGSLILSMIATIITFVGFYFGSAHSLFFCISMGVIGGVTATIAEAVSFRGSDNLSIPLLVCFSLNLIPHLQRTDTLLLFCAAAIIMTTIFLLAFRYRALAPSGLVGAMIMGLLILGYGGMAYLVPLFIFFLLSSCLSRIGKVVDKALVRGSRRDIIQVYANGGVGLIVVLAGYFYEGDWVYPLFLATIAAATADTWATEIGRLFQHQPINLVTGQPIVLGESGGVTWPGSLGGLLGSLVIGWSGMGLADLSWVLAAGVALAGFGGCMVDSLLGATCQARFRVVTQRRAVTTLKDREDGKEEVTETAPDTLPARQDQCCQGWYWLDNDGVNVCCTLSSALLMAGSLYFL